MSAAADWMIYGANGYTGRLIAAEAVRRGLRPTLAGRSREPIEKLAREIGCPHRVFTLDERAAESLAGMQTVLHCAGPFSATARPMVDACLQARVNYLDITGEIEVIEMAAARASEAERAGVAVIPSVGFDVVPSDCLAAALKDALPSARRLRLAFSAFDKVSPGTAKTALEGMPGGGRVRVDGRIVRVPAAWKSREIDFPEGRRTAVTIPWGDVASAFYSTGIPNIEVYMAAPDEQLRAMQRLRWITPLLKLGFVRRFLQRQVARRIQGPTDSELKASRASFWGRVEDDADGAAEATLSTIGGYALTVQTALVFVEAACAGSLRPGYATPSQALGRQVIDRVPGTQWNWIARPGGV